MRRYVTVLELGKATQGFRQIAPNLLLEVNFYVHQEKLILLTLNFINRSRMSQRREVIIWYTSKSIVFHSRQHTMKLKTKEIVFRRKCSER